MQRSSTSSSDAVLDRSGSPSLNPGAARAFLYCAALLGAAEIVLRVGEEPRATAAAALPAEPTLCLALGSSRTMRGLVPAIVEKELAEAGHAGVWAADVARLALTTAGEYQLYREEVRPRLVAGASHGILAIEVRGGGLNDAYLTDDEVRFVASLEPETGAGGAGVATLLWRGQLASAARVALGELRLAHLADRWRRGGGDITGEAGEEEAAEEDASWREGRKGFAPFREPRPAGLRRRFWETQYRTKLLRDYSLGGIQTELLRRFVREVRADGLEPALYVMPVTAIHREFFAPGDYPRFLALVAQLAEEEDVPFFDLDTNHAFPLEQFYDTHHLDQEAARAFSRTFARTVFGSLLEKGRTP